MDGICTETNIKQQNKSRSNADIQQLSKKLSWLLRHGAAKEGLPIQPDGFLATSAIFTHTKFKNYNIVILKKIVETDQKQRYTLRFNPNLGDYEIRANQGHSMEIVQSDSCLEKVTDSCAIADIAHGTYYRFWPSIKTDGLLRKTRNHIHFTVMSDSPHTSKKVISGFRNNCEILIYIDTQKAMKNGLEFYRSENNVILCEGQNGCISTQYFAKVLDRKTEFSDF
ncbi:putative tRNA 2'-phosphotransferase [Teleopsis dalmanni]|uniref:putative tRNA 2'-phosphotransferase n=1 Tax=Teleopsis dalmanni TaxID=139649 RepID=UPI0018CDFA0D|nr:putative tRNA 2'-phosphotransferase [Teleopsis dalmanni]XP_037959891.1 putative tRNA 2'-phosphotransferase [Teleopsis dalmanni]